MKRAAYQEYARCAKPSRCSLPAARDVEFSPIWLNARSTLGKLPNDPEELRLSLVVSAS
jgi:hypothetical protein